MILSVNKGNGRQAIVLDQKLTTLVEASSKAAFIYYLLFNPKNQNF